MNRIVINVHPFVMKQEITVYEGNKTVEYIEHNNLDDLDKICFNLCKKYNIHQIDFLGIKDYGLKLEERMSANFNNYEINFTFH